MLLLNLFGTGRACYANLAVRGFPTQQPCLLLCYLALYRHRPQSREHLAAVFWGEYPTSTSRKYLRNALWRLRQGLQSVGAPADEYLRTDDDTVSFVPGAHCWLDIDAFEVTVMRYRHLSGRQLSSEQADDLEKAVGLYAGHLLEGIYEDWCLGPRERLGLLHMATLGKLMDFCEVNGRYERGLAYGERILAHDNTREKVHRQMMRLHSLLGDRTAALVQYRRCVQILSETLKVSPMPATLRLYEQIVNDSFSAGDAADFAFPAIVNRPGGSTQAMLEQLLYRLERLEATTEATRAELHEITSQMLGALLPTAT
jgi:DNA-binding SARP family transcriptional activator